MATQEKLKPYSDEEVEAKIVEDGLDGWYLEGGWLRRKYSTDGWPSTLMLVNTVGYLCEAAYHHADLSVTWGKLWVKLMTHSSGGITDKDFALARKIEDTVLWRPDAGGVGGENPAFGGVDDPGRSAAARHRRFRAGYGWSGRCARYFGGH